MIDLMMVAPTVITILIPVIGMPSLSPKISRHGCLPHFTSPLYIIILITNLIAIFHLIIALVYSLFVCTMYVLYSKYWNYDIRPTPPVSQHLSHQYCVVKYNTTALL
jgi:hypothetical protein